MNLSSESIANDLKYVTLPGAYPEPDFLNLYNEAYKCWSDVWTAAYKELKVSRQVFSDDFTRQMEVDCVFYKGKCTATLFMNWADLSISKFRQDSYFKVWTDLDISKLSKYGKKVIILSGLAVSPEWRKKQFGINIKDLLLYFVTSRFKYSVADAMTGVTRKAKNVNDLCYRFGANEIRVNVPHFDQFDLVDIVAWYKHTVSEGTDPAIKSLGKELWDRRVTVPRSIVYMPGIDVSLPLQKVA